MFVLPFLNFSKGLKKGKKSFRVDELSLVVLATVKQIGVP